MRLVKEIPHSRYFIQVHEYNSKYLLKITLDSYEQLFKFEKDELLSLDELDGLLTPDFLSNCFARFMSMREDMLKFKKIAK